MPTATVPMRRDCARSPKNRRWPLMVTSEEKRFGRVVLVLGANATTDQAWLAGWRDLVAQAVHGRRTGDEGGPLKDDSLAREPRAAFSTEEMNHGDHRIVGRRLA